MYDQLSHPVEQDGVEKLQGWSNFIYPFLQAVPPGTSEIPQTSDVTPIMLRDATATQLPPLVMWVRPSGRTLFLDVITILLLSAFNMLGKQWARLLMPWHVTRHYKEI
jgi:hypothetical protein